MSGHLLVDERTEVVRTSTWGTYKVLAYTLSASMRVLVRSARGSLKEDGVEDIITRWTGHINEIAELAIEIRGDVHALPQPAVLVSHHVSLLDTPCIFQSWPGRVRMIAKQELRKVPFFGRALEDGGIIFVDRKNLKRAIKQLEAARPLIESGTSLWVAAEGSRSRDGRLGKFKKGAFHIAKQLGVPIVPVWIQGTLDVIPPDQWAAVSSQLVIVSYGDPIAPEGDIGVLIEKTRAAMLELARDAGAPDDVDALADR